MNARPQYLDERRVIPIRPAKSKAGTDV